LCFADVLTASGLNIIARMLKTLFLCRVRKAAPSGQLAATLASENSQLLTVYAIKAKVLAKMSSYSLTTTTETTTTQYLGGFAMTTE
jgi:hypothetical protein